MAAAALKKNNCGGIPSATTLTYSNGLSGSRTITVTPAALPTMTAPADTTVNCGGIPSTPTLSYSKGLSGSCLITGQSNASTFGATPPACGGTVTQTWTATDPCGRVIATVSRTINRKSAPLPSSPTPISYTVNCLGITSATPLTYSNG